MLKHTYAQPYLTRMRHEHVRFVEQLAQRVHELDPHHPVFSIAEHSNQLPGALLDYARGAPSLNVMGVNSYYTQDISDLRNVADEFLPNKPYAVTEFGPDGYWHDSRTPHTSNGGLVEATAVEKATLYESRWRELIEASRGSNVGGVAYCWRDRYEGTPTWFGMTDPYGRAKPSFFAMAAAWGGSDQTARHSFVHDGPVIEKLTTLTQSVTRRDAFIVRADVRLPPGQSADFQWSVVGPNFSRGVARVTTFEDGRGAKIQLSGELGWYRVELKVIGDHGLDDANIPVLLESVTSTPANAAQMTQTTP